MPEAEADRRPSAFVLAGPTASGKTAVAHGLARRLGARILSADSMLVYRHMNVGTAKPPPAELAEFGYAGVDLVDPDGAFSVSDYLRHASETVRSAAARPWIVAGGTGLYVKCLTQGLDSAPGPDAAARAEADAALERGGVPELAGMVRKAGAEPRDASNPRRLVRALEKSRQGCVTSGQAWRTAPPVIVGLLPDRELLLGRIAARVRAMYAGGLVDEVRALRAAWPEWSATASHAIGYGEALAVLDGGLTAAGAIERTAIRTRQLAKRQMTWFRHQANVTWVPVRGTDRPDAIAAEVLRRWEQHGPTRLAV